MTPMRKLSRRDPAAPLTPKAAWGHDFYDFLGRARVSETFAIDGRTEEDYEPVWEADLALRPIWAGQDGYEIRAVADPDFEPETVVLIDAKGHACGFYSGGQLWVDPEHRGRGLGAEMVLAMTEALGTSPTRGQGGLGYSKAGYETHRAAWRLAVARALEVGYPVPQGAARLAEDFIANEEWRRKLAAEEQASAAPRR